MGLEAWWYLCLEKAMFALFFLKSAPKCANFHRTNYGKILKLYSDNFILVQLPHFLSPTEALEGTLWLVRNFLCILSIFDFQVWPSRSHSMGCFSCPKKIKSFKCTYLNIMFSIYIGSSLNRADLVSIEVIIIKSAGNKVVGQWGGTGLVSPNFWLGKPIKIIFTQSYLCYRKR